MNVKIIWAAVLLVGTLSATAQQKNAALPVNANEFLDRHFRNIAITETKNDTDGYDVKLANGFEIEFSKDGKYREVDGKGQPIPTDFINANVVDYVTSKYPGKSITQIEIGKNEIDVDLTDNIDLKFDAKGKFRRVD